MTEIRVAHFDQWQLIREIRIAAMTETPTAYASTVEVEQAKTFDNWQHRFANVISFIAYEGDEAIGLAGAARIDERPTWRELVSMWVAPEHRRKSVATQLVNAVNDWCKTNGVEMLELWVTQGNDCAEQFYLHEGFHLTGRSLSNPRDSSITWLQMKREVSA